MSNNNTEQMNSDFPAEVTFLAGCAVEYDYIYMAAVLDAYDPREIIHSRLFSYISTLDDNPWAQHDIDARIVAVCVKKATAAMGRRLVALSSEGDIEIYSNGDGSIIREKIDEAGVRFGSRGYVTSIREIGNTLFVCGNNDQVYRRNTDGKWTLISAGPLEVRDILIGGLSMLNSIDGTSETDVYTCGFSGRLLCYDGTSWTQIALRTTEHLTCVRCISVDEVWVCGNNGTLLVGNVRAGFKDVSMIDSDQQFWSLTQFKRRIYLATTEGDMFVYDGASIEPVETGFPSGFRTNKVDSVPDMMWSFSPKEIMCFDGERWTRVLHPDNSPIEE